MLATVTCLRVHLAAAPEAGLALPHSMCGNGDVSIVATVSLQQLSKVLQAPLKLLKSMDYTSSM